MKNLGDCISFYLRRRLLLAIMKSIILLFCTTIFGFTTNDVLSQNFKIKFDSNKILSLDQVFDIIEEQTDYKFIYQEGIFDKYPKVKVKKGFITANELLEQSFSSGNLEVTVGVNNTIIVKEGTIKANKPISNIQYRITGLVTDETGTPLAGASVIEKGTTNGTQTDFDGNFSLDVTDENSILLISYIGFGTKEVSVRNQLDLTIQLVAEASTLDEVVITGYGSQIRKTLSSSISKVDGEDIERTPLPSFEAALQGRAAGIQVSTGGAMSGAPVKIRIRGTNSALASSDPLYVIDGIVVQSGTQSNPNAPGGFFLDFGTNVLANLNPNDIESIEVLKDAAATSIYGSRGSNGVILVTTKKGYKGKTKLNLSLDTGLSETTNRLEYVDAKEYIFLAQEAWYNSGNDPADFWNSSGVLVDGLTKEEALNTNTDWQDQALRTGFSTNLNLSISGGNDKTRFYISGGLLDENSIFRGNEYLRLTTRTNLDHTINDRLKVGTSMTYTFVDNNPIPVQEALGKSTNSLPIWPVKNEDGTFFRPIGNVRAAIESWDVNIKSKNFLASWYLNYRITDKLVFRSEYGLNSLNTIDQQFRDGSINSDGQATAFIALGDRNSWNFKNLVNYSNKIGHHNLDILVGIESQKTTQKSSVISGREFINPALKTPQDAGQIQANYDEGAFTFMSYISRLNYDYKGKYLLSLTARRDGSSRFGINNKWGIFPAASVGYILSEEAYFSPLKKVVNFLKIRGSYGLSGNAEIGNYVYATTYAESNYDGNNGITLANIGDDQLGWETTEQLDLGVSMELFDGKIRAEIDYYDKLTYDLLLPVPVSIVTGTSQVTTNLGDISNKGFEIMLGTTNIENKNFSWNSEFTFARNVNEVINLGDNNDGIIIPGLFGSTAIFKGLPIGVQAAPVWLGVDPATGQDIYQDTAGNALRLDQAIDEYGSINNFMNANQVPFGNPFPDFTGGLSNQFKWKNWYANVLFTFEYGADYIASGEAINSKFAFSSFSATPLRNVLNRWRQPGDITPIAQVTTAPTNFTQTTEFVSDVDFIRMRDFTLGYILQPKNVNAFESLNIYLRLTNYLTFTNAKPWVYDPENYRNGGNLNLLGRWKSSPQAKTLTLGINFNF
ncbi:SusC/RagA family TonB-linked outer membrane protein [Flagellimonas marinaquae]|uniref:SusC/RagA family TonB-linked outer membrane protein n=1 Tax=Flagellimonas marinaquae TaxID=254955 RepID=UPI000F8D3E3D|nr:SusC/RagA family TonB-linked outer membrane protein [Allomuricauda aquimarina]